MMTQNDEWVCKHDNGFGFHSGTRYPGIWLCNNLCGYFLNFNPDTFPKGIAYTLDRRGQLNKTTTYRVGKDT